MKVLCLILPVVAMTSPSHAAIIASGLRDIVIYTTFGGVYLDVDAGVLVAEEGAGWDINPFFGGEGVANSPAFQPARLTANVASPVLNLSFGQTVSGANTFAAGYAGSDSHVGPGLSQFDSGNEGYIGFKLTTNANVGPYFGWMRLVLANDGSPGVIRDWAYDDSGSAITIGAIPEPSVLGLAILGSTGFCFRRKRRFDVKSCNIATSLCARDGR